jgi:hypothetical protein
LLANDMSRRSTTPHERVQPDPRALKLFDPIDAWFHEVLPLFVKGGNLWLAMAEPLEPLPKAKLFLMDEMQFMLGYNTEAVGVPREELLRAIERHYGPRPKVM